MSALRSFADRIERLESEIKDLNSDKSDIYKEAKGGGYDVKALRAVIAYRRKDRSEAQEHDAVFQSYLAEIESGTPVATRVHAHEAAPSAPPRPADPVTPPPDFSDLDIPDYLRRSRAPAAVQS